MPGVASTWEATGDEDELGLAPVYKGSCVAKMLAREPGDEENKDCMGSVMQMCILA